MVDAALFKRIAPFLCARSYQYGFRVIGFGLPSGRFRVLDVVIDVAPDEPVITYLRDLTRLGLPFKLEPEASPAQGTAKSGIRNPKSEVRQVQVKRFRGACLGRNGNFRCVDSARGIRPSSIFLQPSAFSQDA